MVHDEHHDISMSPDGDIVSPVLFQYPLECLDPSELGSLIGISALPGERSVLPHLGDGLLEVVDGLIR